MGWLDNILSGASMVPEDDGEWKKPALKPSDDPRVANFLAREGYRGSVDEGGNPMPPERSDISSWLMRIREALPENPDTQWSASNMARGALERSANLQDTVAGYRDPKTADPLDLVPMLAPGAVAGAMRTPARSTLMSAGGVPPKEPFGFTAYHGSPHEFDRFSMDKIGSGEGAQAYGHGLYFADSENVARSYRDGLRQKVNNPAEAFADEAWRASNSDPIAAKAAIASRRDRILDAHKRSGASRSQLDETRAHYDEAERLIDGGFKTGSMYEVRIKADPADFLDWDKPLSAQGDKVRGALEPLGFKAPDKGASRSFDDALLDALGGGPTTLPPAPHDPMGMDIIRKLNSRNGSSWLEPSKAGESAASGALRDAGIPGIRYDDAMTRGKGEGTRNTVVFDDKLIEILRKYGLIGAVAAPGAWAPSREDQ